MWRIIKITLVFFFLCVAPSHAQDTIYWDAQRPLAWEDFHGKPDATDLESAQAATGVALAFRFRENLEAAIWEYEYDVYSYFLSDLSWYRRNDINYYLLEHEQTHFNISELYARKLKKELSQLTASNTVGDEAEYIYHKIQKQHAALQNKYDRETKHSLNIDQELEWQKQIRDSLKTYHDWQ